MVIFKSKSAQVSRLAAYVEKIKIVYTINHQGNVK